MLRLVTMTDFGTRGLLIEALLTFFSTLTVLLVCAAAAWHVLRALRRRVGAA